MVTNTFFFLLKNIIKKNYKMSEISNISFILLKKYIREEEKSIRILFLFYSLIIFFTKSGLVLPSQDLTKSGFTKSGFLFKNFTKS